jgi:hypothetical protein
LTAARGTGTTSQRSSSRCRAAHTSARARAHPRTHAQASTHTHERAHARARTRTNTRTHASTHTCTHTHTHTGAHARTHAAGGQLRAVLLYLSLFLCLSLSLSLSHTHTLSLSAAGGPPGALRGALHARAAAAHLRRRRHVPPAPATHTPMFDHFRFDRGLISGQIAEAVPRCCASSTSPPCPPTE